MHIKKGSQRGAIVTAITVAAVLALASAAFACAGFKGRVEWTIKNTSGVTIGSGVTVGDWASGQAHRECGVASGAPLTTLNAPKGANAASITVNVTHEPNLCTSAGTTYNKLAATQYELYKAPDNAPGINGDVIGPPNACHLPPLGQNVGPNNHLTIDTNGSSNGPKIFENVTVDGKAGRIHMFCIFEDDGGGAITSDAHAVNLKTPLV